MFGRIRRGVQAQGALVGAAEEDLRNVQVSLAAEVARAYFELRGAQELLAVAQRNGENQRRTLQLTRERLEGGRGTAFDTERAQTQLSITLALIPPFEERVAQAQYRLGVLLGRPPAEVANELKAVAPMPPLPTTVTVSAPDTLIRRRPDVAAAERRVAAEHAFVGSAKAEYWPRLSVGGNAGVHFGRVRGPRRRRHVPLRRRACRHLAVPQSRPGEGAGRHRPAPSKTRHGLRTTGPCSRRSRK